MISQKATTLCIYEILKKYSDEHHVLTTDKIREKLKIIYDVDMERRAIYRNIEALRSMGIEISDYKDNYEGYYLMERDFELSEVRLLCDAVAQSDMIKEATGKEIIKKLIDTQSIFQGRMLQKTVFVKTAHRIPNKQTFYNIDALNTAINQGCKVSVKLLEYGMNHELVEGNGSPVVISPYVTLWAAGNYYIIAKIEATDDLTHFRIDMLKDIYLLERGVDMIFGGINPGQYATAKIILNNELKEHYDITCDISLWQEIADLFGTDATLLHNRNSFESDIKVRIHTIPSRMRSFVMNHLCDCEVTSPKHFRDEIQKMVFNAYKKYW